MKQGPTTKIKPASFTKKYFPWAPDPLINGVKPYKWVFMMSWKSIEHKTVHPAYKDATDPFFLSICCMVAPGNGRGGQASRAGHWVASFGGP